MPPGAYYRRWEAGFLDLLSPEWIDHLRKRSTFLLQSKARSKTVVVHIVEEMLNPVTSTTKNDIYPTATIGQHQTNEHRVTVN